MAPSGTQLQSASLRHNHTHTHTHTLTHTREGAIILTYDFTPPHLQTKVSQYDIDYTYLTYSTHENLPICLSVVAYPFLEASLDVASLPTDNTN